MAIKELKSVDISSYTVISTGIATLTSIILSIIIVGLLAISVPNSLGTMIYIIPTIVFGTMICTIFFAFSEAYLYNVLSKRFSPIKFDIEENCIKKISTKETALIVTMITAIITIVVYLALSMIVPLFLSSLITILMYASQTAVATAIYQAMIYISSPLVIAIGLISTIIIMFIFTLLGTYIYNLLGDSDRGILVELKTEDKLTQLESIKPLNFGIAIGAITLILNIILGLIMIISGSNMFGTLSTVLGSFFIAFIEALLIAAFYNFLAPKIGKLKVELE
jgi:hypothetical protein